MTNQQHPITPPKDLLEQLRYEPGPWMKQITIAYRAGADQELEACAEWLSERTVCMGDQLRSARRPKPSLKEQALALLDKAEDPSWDINDFSILRQALEALPND